MELLCIGNALVDVFASADEYVDIRYGITRPVQHIEIEKLIEILGVLPGFTAVSGGGAANVAKIAALLEAGVVFSGAVGKKSEGSAEHPDHFGQLFEKDLAAAGVKLSLSIKPVPTGICLILKNEEGETRVAASPSASLCFEKDDISEEEIKNAKIVVIDGFMLDRPGLVRHILELADKHGTIAAIDLSSSGIAKENAELVAGFTKQYSLILFMNEAEAEAFYLGLASPPAGEEKENSKTRVLPFAVERRKTNSVLRRACSFFRYLTSRELYPAIVVKLGARGAICFAGGDMYRAETMSVIPFETTGAGDAFSAAFLIAWVRNKPIFECASLGNKAARIILDVAGTKVDAKQLKGLAKQLK